MRRTPCRGRALGRSAGRRRGAPLAAAPTAGQAVPRVKGLTIGKARAKLSAAGYKPSPTVWWHVWPAPGVRHRRAHVAVRGRAAGQGQAGLHRRQHGTARRARPAVLPHDRKGHLLLGRHRGRARQGADLLAHVGRLHRLPLRLPRQRRRAEGQAPRGLPARPRAARSRCCRTTRPGSATASRATSRRTTSCASTTTTGAASCCRSRASQRRTDPRAPSVTLHTSLPGDRRP